MYVISVTGSQAVDGTMLEFLDADALTELGVHSGLDRARLLGATARLPGARAARFSAQGVEVPSTPKEEELARELQLARQAEAAALSRAAEAADQAAESSAALHSFIQEQFTSPMQYTVAAAGSATAHGQASGADPTDFWAEGHQHAVAPERGERFAQNPYDSHEEEEKEECDWPSTIQTPAATVLPSYVSQDGLNVSDQLAGFAGVIRHSVFVNHRANCFHAVSPCWIDYSPQELMQFVETGGLLTIYLASGKRKHDRTFWLERRGGDFGANFDGRY